jgi:hypothetical protein
MGGRKRDWSKDQKRELMHRHGTESVSEEFGENPHGFSFRHQGEKASSKQNVSTVSRPSSLVQDEPIRPPEKYRIVRRAGEPDLKRLRLKSAKQKKTTPKVNLKRPTLKSETLYAGKRNFMEGVIVERKRNGIVASGKDKGQKG